MLLIRTSAYPGRHPCQLWVALSSWLKPKLHATVAVLVRGLCAVLPAALGDVKSVAHKLTEDEGDGGDIVISVRLIPDLCLHNTATLLALEGVVVVPDRFTLVTLHLVLVLVSVGLNGVMLWLVRADIITRPVPSKCDFTQVLHLWDDLGEQMDTETLWVGHRLG